MKWMWSGWKCEFMHYARSACLPVPVYKGVAMRVSQTSTCIQECLLCLSIYICVWEGEGEKVRESLQDSCWFPADLMSRQSLSSKNCLPALLRGRTSFSWGGIFSHSLPLLFLSTHQNSPVVLSNPTAWHEQRQERIWKSASNYRVGSCCEIERLIYKKHGVKRLLAASLPY